MSQEQFSPTDFTADQVRILSDRKLWKDVKEKADRLVIAYEARNMAVIAKTKDLLQILLSVGIRAFSGAQLVFYIDEVLFSVIKNIIDHREYQLEENYLLAEEIILSTIQLCHISIDSDYPKLAEILALIFNTTRMLYSKDIILKHPQSNFITALGAEFVRDEARQNWENELKVGDIIDCVKVDATSIWSRAEIQSSDSFLRLSFLENPFEYRVLNRNSNQIAPLGTRCFDFEWRSNLKVGDEVDAADTLGIWHKSTIVGEETGKSEYQTKTERHLIIGFRIYPNGLDNSNFIGLDSTFDVSLSPHSCRILKLNKVSRKGYAPAQRFGRSFYPEDVSDYLYEVENSEEKLYALHRGRKNSNIVRFLNYFGRLGGFDAIANRLERSNAEAGYCPLEIIANWMEVLSNVATYFYIDFAKEYVPRIWQALSTSLMSPTEQYLRTYDKERLENIINSLESLLLYAYNGEDKIKYTENLSLTLSLKCYQSDVLKQRIAGLKLINQIIKYVLQQDYKDADNVEMRTYQFADWLKQHQIVENLYINSIHSEMINRSGDLLKFIAVSNVLTSSLALEIFSAMDRQDEMTQQGFLKLLSDTASWFKFPQASFILENLQKTDVKELSSQHIDTIYELVRFKKPAPSQQALSTDSNAAHASTSSDAILSANNNKDTTNATTVAVILEQKIPNAPALLEINNSVNPNTISALWYLYGLITSPNNAFKTLFNAELQQKIIDRFCNLIGLEDGLTQGVAFLHSCVNDIRKNISVSQLLKIIKQIIENYPTQQPLIVGLPVGSLNSNRINNILPADEENPQQDKSQTSTSSEKPEQEQSQSQQELVETRASISRSLVQKQGLIDVVLENIQVVKQLTKKKLDSHNSNSSSSNAAGQATAAGERASLLKVFKQEIAERIDFIKFLNGILVEKIITSEFLEQVWRDIVEDPLDIDERDFVFKWLRELADSTSKNSSTAVVGEVECFLKNQLMLNSAFIEQLSYDGFLCYKAMFLSLNLTKKHLTNPNAISFATTAQQKRYNYNQFGQVTSISGGSDPNTAGNNNNNNNNTSNQNQNDSSNDHEYIVLIRPQDLHGMELLWEIVFNNKNSRVIESCLQFLVSLHLSLDESTQKDIKYSVRYDLIKNLFNRIKSLDREKESDQIKRVVDILMCLLSESEKKGIGHLISLIGLVKGEMQSLTITNDITFVQDGLKKQDIKIQSNRSIIDLKILIGSKVGCSWDQVKIVRASTFGQLKDSDNSRTVGEIRFKANENLIIEKRNTVAIPESALLNAEGKAAEKPLEIFTTWFYKFANADTKLMNQEGLGKFIMSCTGDNCSPDDYRVVGTFNLWDTDKDGALTLSDFIAFYESACRDKKSVVWKNLHSHGYRNDLKHLSEIGEDLQDLDILPRKIIMDNAEFYDIMYGLLDVSVLADPVMNLLNRLPASPLLLKRILSLEGVKNTQNPEWNSILDTKNSFRLLSTLTLIEYFMEDEDEPSPDSDDKGETKAIEGDASSSAAAAPADTVATSAAAAGTELEKNPKKGKAARDLMNQLYQLDVTIDSRMWREEFISCGGFDQLFKVFTLFSNNDHYAKLPINIKNILSFILRIMKNYLTAVFATKVDHLFKINTYTVQVKYSLDVINDNLRNAETGEKPEEQAQQNQEQQQQQQQQPVSDEHAAELASGLSSIAIPYSLDQMNLPGPIGNPQSQTGNAIGQLLKAGLSFFGWRTLVKETSEFLQLVEKMRGKLGEMILASLDIGQMLRKMLEIAVSIVSIEGELESEDRGIVDFCCVIILDIVLYDTAQRALLLTDYRETFNTLILKGLFHQNLNTRRVFSHMVYLISRYDKSTISAHILDLLMANVPQSKDVSKSDCNQYYELLCKIIEESKSIVDVSINFASLMSETIQNITEHVSLEGRYNGKNDKMMIGFLNLCEKILKIEPALGATLEPFAKYLFDVCLFCKDPEELLEQQLDFAAIQEKADYEFNPPFYVKCKSSESRRAAFKVLLSILKSNKNIFSTIVSDGLNTLIDNLRTPPSWNYRPSNEQKCHYNYLGIKNLSQICYMNSMLQQFYMTETFRYGILAADDQKEAELVEYRGQFYDDNLLHQFQKMFSYLNLSDRQDYNPTGFCFSFKDYMGEPVNVGVQQDAQEFLNMIFDKLESGLRSTPFKYLLESVYGGKTCSQMKCSACGNVKTKHELFYTQQLRVEGSKKLSDSFLKMIEGETISDFKCDECGKRCDQSRRTCFSQLPNVLIVQLQRIVFDLDTFVNKKINSRVEFPHVLDLTEYTVDYLEKKEREAEQSQHEQEQGQDQSQPGDKQDNADPSAGDSNSEPASITAAAAAAAAANEQEPPVNLNEYRLKGITVHQGTAELGHYFSYINYKEDKWLEFNDSRIREFNPKNIEAECFGGSSSNNSDNYWEKGENSKNAYILVYERIAKCPLKIVTTDPEQKAQVEESLSLRINPEKDTVNQDSNERTSEIDYFSVKQRIPKRLFVNTWLDNHNFMLEKHVYSIEFLTFLKDLLHLIEKPADSQILNSTKSVLYKHHLEIPAEDIKMYENTLWMTGKLFFNIFFKASDFEIMKELAIFINYFIDIIPQMSYKFAAEFIFSRFKQIQYILTSCHEPVVRTAIINVIVHTINALTNYYGLTLLQSQAQFVGLEENQLSEKDICERETVTFLDAMLSLLDNEVPKNWLRMHQYLEFWKIFAEGGEQQVAWCMKNEMIARLIDFFLGKTSPLNCFSKKEHEVGNRFVRTPFEPLIQCVSYLVCQVKSFTGENVDGPQYEFSKNDSQMLDVEDFYRQAMHENYDTESICKIGASLCYKQKQFSESLGRVILTGIFKSNSEHIPQYLDNLQAYLLIDDAYKAHRIEWMFGYAVLKINSNTNPNESTASSNNANAGADENQPSEDQSISGEYACRAAFDEQIVVYETKLKSENLKSVLEVLYKHRKSWENICLHMLKRVLLLAKSDTQILNYIMRLPSPCIASAHYLSWVRSHLESIIPADTSARAYQSPKELLAKEIMVIYQEVEAVLNAPVVKEILETIPESSNPPIRKKQLFNQQPSYIIGKTVAIEEISNTPLEIQEEQLEEEEEEEEQEEKEQKTHQVFLREIEYTTYYTDSQPTGTQNLIFPDTVLNDGQISVPLIDIENSNISDYFIIPSKNTSDTNVSISVSYSHLRPALKCVQLHNEVVVVQGTRPSGHINGLSSGKNIVIENSNLDLIQPQRVGLDANNLNFNASKNQMKVNENVQNFLKGNLGGDNKQILAISEEDSDGLDSNNNNNISGAAEIEAMKKQDGYQFYGNNSQQNQNAASALNNEEPSPTNSYNNDAMIMSKDQSNNVSINSNQANVGEDPDAQDSNILSELDVGFSTPVLTTPASSTTNTNNNEGEQSASYVPSDAETAAHASASLSNNTNDNRNDNAGTVAVIQPVALPLVELNFPVSKGPVVRRFILENWSSEHSVVVEVSFLLSEGEVDAQSVQHENRKASSTSFNQIMPKEIVLEIEPLSSVTFFSMRKINPVVSWSAYKVNTVTRVKASKNAAAGIDSTNAATVAAEKKNNNAVNITSANLSSEPVITDAFSFVEDEVSDVMIGPQLPPLDLPSSSNNTSSNNNQNGEKTCPVCTFIQPAYNYACDVCESPF